MMELVTNVLGLIDMSRPCHDKTDTRSAQMGCDLLEQGEGRIHRPGPACWIYLIGIWSSHLVDIVQLFFERLIRVPCKLGQFIKGAFGTTLTTGAIVAFDKPDTCIEIGTASSRERVCHYV